MIILTVGEIGEIGEGIKGFVCAVYNDEKEIQEQRPLDEMFRDFIMALKTTETEDSFNQLAEKIKGDLQKGMDFIERLQMQTGSYSTH